MGSDTVIAIPHHLQHLVTTAASDEENIVNSNFLQENDLSDHVHITNILDEKASSRNEALDRWPTLFEILNRKTQAPVDLWSFYVYMRDTQQSIDYLDFWLDSVQHINLCKAYVKGLKKSIIVDGANAKQYKLDGGYDDYDYDDDYDDTYDDEDYDEENEKTRVMEDQQRQQLQQQQQPQQQQQGSTQQDDLDAYDSQLIPPSALAGPEALNANRNSNLTNRSSNSTGNISGFNNQSNRNSNTKSVSSSVLLDLLMKQDLLEDNDAQRLSQFLRGEGSIRTSDPLIRSKINDLDKRTQNMRNSNLSLINNPNDPSNTPGVMGSGSNLNIDATANEAVAAANEITNTIIKPEMVETLIKQEMEKANRRSQQQYGNGINNDEVKRQNRKSKSHYVTRVLLRRSTQHLLNTYFTENAEKKIVIPEDMVRRVLYSLEVEGRDDPEVFDEAREYVFKAMEHEAYPNFLRYNAMGNITQNSTVYRLIFAIFCAFAGFWVGYALIFLKWDPKPERAVVTIPFFFSSYSFFSSIFRIDPILMFLGYGENKLGSYGLVKIKEPFVKKFLIKRSLFVSFLICIVAAAFSIIFALVPGRRIQS
ncbi:hypothetical protein B5S31_g2470 [[Candida] boidinii]|nr:hypothetical protein B5S29_g2281 [[Candida] boidinii]OWB72749.1 hypothetical protein B5S31_g2470 [[Candida] boidinii]